MQVQHGYEYFGYTGIIKCHVFRQLTVCNCKSTVCVRTNPAQRLRPWHTRSTIPKKNLEMYMQTLLTFKSHLSYQHTLNSSDSTVFPLTLLVIQIYLVTFLLTQLCYSCALCLKLPSVSFIISQFRFFWFVCSLDPSVCLSSFVFCAAFVANEVISVLIEHKLLQKFRGGAKKIAKQFKVSKLFSTLP